MVSNFFLANFWLLNFFPANFWPQNFFPANFRFQNFFPANFWLQDFPLRIFGSRFYFLVNFWFQNFFLANCRLHNFLYYKFLGSKFFSLRISGSRILAQWIFSCIFFQGNFSKNFWISNFTVSQSFEFLFTRRLKHATGRQEGRPAIMLKNPLLRPMAGYRGNCRAKLLGSSVFLYYCNFLKFRQFPGELWKLPEQIYFLTFHVSMAWDMNSARIHRIHILIFWFGQFPCHQWNLQENVISNYIILYCEYISKYLVSEISAVNIYPINFLNIFANLF